MTAGAARSGDERGLWGHYCGFVSRFAGYIVDLVVSTGVFMLALAAASFAASLVTGHTINWNRSDIGVGIALAAWQFLYYAYSWAAAGKTFGMALLGTRVVRRNGADLDVTHAIIRTLAFPLSFLLCGLGFAGILFGRERRALHDVIADTAVVYTWEARPQRLRYLTRATTLHVPAQTPDGATAAAAANADVRIPARQDSPERGLARGDAAEQFVDDPCGEGGSRGRRVMLASGHHGAGEREHRDLHVGVRAEFAAGDAAAEHRAHQFAARLHDLFLVPGQQPRVALAFAVQQRELPRVPGIVGVGGHDADHRD